MNLIRSHFFKLLLKIVEWWNSDFKERILMWEQSQKGIKILLNYIRDFSMGDFKDASDDCGF